MLDAGLTVRKAHYGANPGDLPTVDEMAAWLSGKESK